MGLITIISAIFISVLILIGGIYIFVYEGAPTGELLQILLVGWGMWIGVSVSLLS